MDRRLSNYSTEEVTSIYPKFNPVAASVTKSRLRIHTLSRHPPKIMSRWPCAKPLQLTKKNKNMHAH